MKPRHVTLVGGVIVAVLLATVLMPDQVPLGIVLKGALFGAATGLLGVGLVLTYRTTRIINSSYGAMGTLGGGLAAGYPRARAGTGARRHGGHRRGGGGRCRG